MTNITGRAKVVAKLLVAHKEQLGASLRVQETLAAANRLHPTDLLCIEFLLRNDGGSAGELAKHTGLTTGAVTGLIDRLERGGYLRREIDKKDRRKVHIKVLTRKTKQLSLLLQTLQAEAETLMSSYTIEELAIITDFLTRRAALDLQQAQKIKD